MALALPLRGTWAVCRTKLDIRKATINKLVPQLTVSCDFFLFRSRSCLALFGYKLINLFFILVCCFSKLFQDQRKRDWLPLLLGYQLSHYLWILYNLAHISELLDLSLPVSVGIVCSTTSVWTHNKLKIKNYPNWLIVLPLDPTSVKVSYPFAIDFF